MERISDYGDHLNLHRDSPERDSPELDEYLRFQEDPEAFIASKKQALEALEKQALENKILDSVTEIFRQGREALSKHIPSLSLDERLAAGEQGSKLIPVKKAAARIFHTEKSAGNGLASIGDEVIEGLQKAATEMKGQIQEMKSNITSKLHDKRYTPLLDLDEDDVRSANPGKVQGIDGTIEQFKKTGLKAVEVVSEKVVAASKTLKNLTSSEPLESIPSQQPEEIKVGVKQSGEEIEEPPSDLDKQLKREKDFIKDDPEGLVGRVAYNLTDEKEVANSLDDAREHQIKLSLIAQRQFHSINPKREPQESKTSTRPAQVVRSSNDTKHLKPTSAANTPIVEALIPSIELSVTPQKPIEQALLGEIQANTAAGTSESNTKELESSIKKFVLDLFRTISTKMPNFFSQGKDKAEAKENLIKIGNDLIDKDKKTSPSTKETLKLWFNENLNKIAELFSKFLSLQPEKPLERPNSESRGG